MEKPSELARLQAKSDIRSLKARYCYCIDNFNPEEWVTLFAENATMTGGLPHQADHQGRDELRGRLEAVHAENRRYMSHSAANPSITLDEESATGLWNLDVVSVFADGTFNWMRGQYDEEYTLVGDEWRFSYIDVAVQCRLAFDGEEWSVTLSGSGSSTKI
jgi:hypothetical protein